MIGITGAFTCAKMERSAMSTCFQMYGMRRYRKMARIFIE